METDKQGIRRSGAIGVRRHIGRGNTTGVGGQTQALSFLGSTPKGRNPTKMALLHLDSWNSEPYPSSKTPSVALIRLNLGHSPHSAPWLREVRSGLKTYELLPFLVKAKVKLNVARIKVGIRDLSCPAGTDEM